MTGCLVSQLPRGSRKSTPFFLTLAARMRMSLMSSTSTTHWWEQISSTKRNAAGSSVCVCVTYVQVCICVALLACLQLMNRFAVHVDLTLCEPVPRSSNFSYLLLCVILTIRRQIVWFERIGQGCTPALSSSPQPLWWVCVDEPR